MILVKSFLIKNLMLVGLLICFSCGNPKLTSNVSLDNTTDKKQTQGSGTETDPSSSSQNIELFSDVIFNQTVNLGDYQKNINDINSLGINADGNLLVFFKTGISLLFDLTKISTTGYTPTKLENTLAIDSNPTILSLGTNNDSWIYLIPDKKLGRNMPILATTGNTSTSSKNLFIDLTNGGKSYLHSVDELGIISASSNQIFALTDNYFQVFTYAQDKDKFSVLEIPLCDSGSTNCQNNSVGVGAGISDTGYWLATTQQFYTFDKDNVKNTYIPNTFKISKNFQSALKVMFKIKNNSGTPKIDSLAAILSTDGIKIQNTATTTPSVTNQSTTTTSTPNTETSSTITLSSNFQSQCSICHGNHGEGKLPQFPKLQKTALDITTYINIVRKGKGSMPLNTVITDADLQKDYSVLKAVP
jgi:hypothetical protein